MIFLLVDELMYMIFENVISKMKLVRFLKKEEFVGNVIIMYCVKLSYFILLFNYIVILFMILNCFFVCILIVYLIIVYLIYKF